MLIYPSRVPLRKLQTVNLSIDDWHIKYFFNSFLMFSVLNRFRKLRKKFTVKLQMGKNN